MHPQTTNMLTQTRDVHRFGFESAGALELEAAIYVQPPRLTLTGVRYIPELTPHPYGGQFVLR
jgi:hypothetical protein